ncbi:MAG: hypothetical protein WBG89_05220 [Ornithinimicrobium sp.]
MDPQTSGKGGLKPRQIIALVFSAVAVILIAINWEQTDIWLLVATVTMPLSIALIVVFIGGMGVGALLFSRRHPTQ